MIHRLFVEMSVVRISGGVIHNRWADKPPSVVFESLGGWLGRCDVLNF